MCICCPPCTVIIGLNTYFSKSITKLNSIDHFILFTSYLGTNVVRFSEKNNNRAEKEQKQGRSPSTAAPLQE